MMDISKINRSQHENHNFLIFGINIKAQSEFSHMNSLIPFLIHGPYHKGPLLIRLPPASAGYKGLVYDYNLFNDIYILRSPLSALVFIDMYVKNVNLFLQYN